MDELLSQWLVYLEGRISDVESNRRGRILTVNSIGILLIGSIVYWATSGQWLLGLAGLLLSFLLFGVMVFVNLRDAAFVAAAEFIIKKILAGTITDPAQVSGQLYQQFDASRRFGVYLKKELELSFQTGNRKPDS